MPDEPERSRAARRAAETALARVVHHYGVRPEFVVLGGLVPDLLCAGSPFQHAGTTDIGVQVKRRVDTQALAQLDDEAGQHEGTEAVGQFTA